MGEDLKAGGVGWIDLTVPGAVEVRKFYEAVVGWGWEPVPMGDYEDFNMVPAGGEAVAGICHARGANAKMPPAWMLYFLVEDLDASLAACRAGGGEVVVAERRMGDSRFCVIRDPAGAVCALYQP